MNRVCIQESKVNIFVYLTQEYLVEKISPVKLLDIPVREIQNLKFKIV